MENKARALFFGKIYGTVPVHWDAKQGYGNTGIRHGVPEYLRGKTYPRGQ